MAKISVVINTYNEEKRIKRCLDSVRFADEIVIVDMYSKDRTIEIAKKYTKHIFLHKQLSFVEPARNFAINKATGDWILILDADEELPEHLADTLRALADSDSADYVKLPRKNIMFGKWVHHTGWWPDHLIRFFKKGKIHWKNEIHSIPDATGKELTLTGEENAIIHHSYESISEFLHKNLEIYAKEEAEEKIKLGYTFNYKDAVRYPLQEFLSRYFARQGYKDGFHGFMLAILMSVYHFAVFAYLWEKKNFVDVSSEDINKGLKDEVQNGKKEIAHWIHQMNIEESESSLKKFALRVKKKLTL